MLNKIIGFSLQNRILVLVASVLLLIGGTYTAMHTEVDVFPDLNAPTVVIIPKQMVWQQRKWNSWSLFP